MPVHEPSTSLTPIIGAGPDPSELPDPVFPEVGDTFGDFQLIAELGRGGQGCVFLARQRFLGDRPVVIKLSACDGREHLSLARLQHTYIVPLYVAEDDDERNLRVLCMPYFGNATLKHVQDVLKPIPVGQRTGQTLLDALDGVQESAPVPLSARGPARLMIARASYVQAICWVGSCLAEALNYAHERGLVHLDIKPSNVLLAVDGQPMLLDFHLAQPPIQLGSATPNWLGGSPLYMSPEHKATLNAVRKDQAITLTVDGRADVFALGALLYEALGGALPFRSETSRRLHSVNPKVSVGLSDIIHKCLAPDANCRYETAGRLASDLQRHLTHQPLIGVRNRNLRERWQKWRRRRPYALAGVGLVVAVIIASIGLIWFRQNNVSQLRRQLVVLRDTCRDQLSLGWGDHAASTARHGLALAAGTPGNLDVAAELGRLLRSAERVQAAHELAAVTDRLRYCFGTDTLPSVELKALESQCRLFWENRKSIVDRLGAEATEAVTARLRTDLLDLALLWTDLRMRLASPEQHAAVREEALCTLHEVEGLFGPNAVIAVQRAAIEGTLGTRDRDQTPIVVPQTAWEQYAVGRVYFISGNLEHAAAAFSEACNLDPKGFWPNFYDGLCAYRQTKYLDAASAFSVCIGSEPNNAASYFNRALAYTSLERNDRAVHDYNRALKLDPKLAAAALNRGLVYYREKRYEDALSDLKLALELGSNPATVHYNSALIYLAMSQHVHALECTRAALRADPLHDDARHLQQSIEKRAQKK